jgi:hypothetical protein
MLKANRTYLLLLIIFAFSFIYRMTLMLWAGFPSGADIGLHSSVIHSITGSGNTNFLYNAYQMGGGISLTFPGYHIFASALIMMTGLPEYVAQVAIVSLFSSLIVLCTFLITKSVWNQSAAFIVAILAAISRFDIEMLLWGGYPNVITLLLIPITLYLYLQKNRFSLTPFLISTSILVGSIFLTHSLSAAIFVGVTLLTVLFVMVAPNTFGASRKTGIYWLIPMVAGAILVAPFVINAIPTYMHGNSSSPGVQGVNDINSAILSTRILPLEWVLPLFLIILAFALFSKRYSGRFFTLPTLLLSMWLFVPLFLTQGYLFGFIIDYNRFLYFIIFPTIIFVAVLINHGSEFFADVVKTYRLFASQTQKPKKDPDKRVVWLSAHLTNKACYSGVLLFFLLFSFIALPIFMTPSQGIGQTIQSYYQVMNDPGWQGIQWAKQNTPANSVFVSDALYGWWFGGFAQRPTLSAVDPQYITSARELAPAKNASYLLDTDYVIDNGYFQVREDGGYISRHNPEVLAHIKNYYFPYAFFNFDNDQTIISLKNGQVGELYNLSRVPVIDMHIEGNANAESIIITHGNDLFNFTQTVTVYAASNESTTKMVQFFADITQSIQTDNPAVTLDTLQLRLPTKGTLPPIIAGDYSVMGLVDTSMKTIGQIIFPNQQSRPYYILTPKGSQYSPIDMFYTLASKTNEFSFSMGVYQYTDQQAANSTFEELVEQNTQTYLTEMETYVPPLKAETNFYVFDYKKALADWNISYLILRDFEQLTKFAKDPAFSLVFINSEVAIFKING